MSLAPEKNKHKMVPLQNVVQNRPKKKKCVFVNQD